MEVAVETVHGDEQGLLGLRRERGRVGDIEDVLARPKVDPAVPDVVDERCPFVEGLEDSIAGRGRAELTEVQLSHVVSSERRGGDLIGIGFEVSGPVGVVRDEDDRGAGEADVTCLIGDDLVHHRPGFGERRGGETSDGEVGQDVVAVHGGEGRVGGGP